MAAPNASGVAYPALKLYVIPGSQYCAKVLAALDSRKIPFETVEVSFLNRSVRMKELPSDGYLVPELTVAQPDGSEKVIPDSSAILREIDSLLPSSAESFFGDNAISEAEKHASTTINSFVLYFNHVSDEGWRRSIREKAFSSIPFPIRYLIPYGVLLSSTRARFREQVMREICVEEDGLNDDAMRAKLVTELGRYEEALRKSDSEYL